MSRSEKALISFFGSRAARRASSGSRRSSQVASSSPSRTSSSLAAGSLAIGVRYDNARAHAALSPAITRAPDGIPRAPIYTSPGDL